jgi:hypothetical protein
MNRLRGTFLAGLLVAATAVGSPAQTITSFDDPSAGTASGQGTIAVAINTAGTTTGAYIDKNNVGHGFMRTSKAKYTSFDAPGKGSTTEA